MYAQIFVDCLAIVTAPPHSPVSLQPHPTTTNRIHRNNRTHLDPERYKPALLLIFGVLVFVIGVAMIIIDLAS